MDIEAIRDRLQLRRREIFETVAHVEDDLHWLDTNIEPEIEEEGQEENIARLLSRLDDRGKAEIEAIDRALGRIASGDYGRCGDCGELIPDGRLHVLPTAELCVPCAEQSARPG